MIVNEENFVLYAAKNYENFNCETQEEFEEDIARFKYLKKLFFVYENKKDLKERLILNHIIILYNLFGAQACTKMLLLKMKGYYSYLFPFLIFLDYLPKDQVLGVFTKDTIIRISDFPLDMEIVKRLREIKKING